MKELIKKLKEQGHFDEDLGLSKSEIDELKDSFDSEIPSFFTTYLKNFGFNENLFWTIFNEEDEFVAQNEFIRNELGYIDYLVIGDEYGENFILANNETQQLFLLEDDHLIDLKITFEAMLVEIVDSLQPVDYETQKEVNTIYQSLLTHKNEISKSIKNALDQLITAVTENDDQLYSIILSQGKGNNYYAFGGSLEDFNNKTDSENINYDELFSSDSAKYEEKIDFNFLKQEANLNFKKALDLVCLEVLRDLKNGNYFENQVENISISVASNNINFFPEDTYGEALTKKNDLETKIKRFWETPYDRTRLILENL